LIVTQCQATDQTWPVRQKGITSNLLCYFVLLMVDKRGLNRGK